MEKDLFKNIKEFREYMYLENLKSKFGNQTEAEKQIEIFDKMGCFENRTQKYRLKKEIQKAYNIPLLTSDNTITKELDNKVIEHAKYCE